MIDKFQGEYRWLSNFHEANILVYGNWYTTNEHAYQAAKTLVPYDRKRIREAMRPGQAKKLGRRVKVRHDWEDVKLFIMESLVRQKFFNDPHLGRFLLATENDYIQEGNWWRDNFWGIDLKTGEGKNHLGKILMKVREELRSEV